MGVGVMAILIPRWVFGATALTVLDMLPLFVVWTVFPAEQQPQVAAIVLANTGLLIFSGFLVKAFPRAFLPIKKT